MIRGWAFLACAAAQLWAGGFWVELGHPGAHPGAKAMNAVVTLRLMGCGNPAKAPVEAVAVGRVDGKRREVAVKLAALDQAGLYAVTRQWPEEGRWVLRIVARDGDHVTSAMVVDTPGGFDRHKAVWAAGPPDPAQLERLLDRP